MDRRVRTAGLLVFLALGIVGCRAQRATSHDPATSNDPATSKPPAAAQGPVNPDPRVTHYACVDGQTITAGYPDHETAVVTYKDHAYTLKLARSASGARYIGYGLQWWVKGDHASIAELKAGEDVATAQGLECDAADGQPAATPVTRTSLVSPPPQR